MRPFLPRTLLKAEVHMLIEMPFHTKTITVNLPENATILHTSYPEPENGPAETVELALRQPVASPALSDLIKNRRSGDIVHQRRDRQSGRQLDDDEERVFGIFYPFPFLSVYRGTKSTKSDRPGNAIIPVSTGIHPVNRAVRGNSESHPDILR